MTSESGKAAGPNLELSYQEMVLVIGKPGRPWNVISVGMSPHFNMLVCKLVILFSSPASKTMFWNVHRRSHSNHTPQFTLWMPRTCTSPALQSALGEMALHPWSPRLSCTLWAKSQIHRRQRAGSYGSRKRSPSSFLTNPSARRAVASLCGFAKWRAASTAWTLQTWLAAWSHSRILPRTAATFVGSVVAACMSSGPSSGQMDQRLRIHIGGAGWAVVENKNKQLSWQLCNPTHVEHVSRSIIYGRFWCMFRCWKGAVQCQSGNNKQLTFSGIWTSAEVGRLHQLHL